MNIKNVRILSKLNVKSRLKKFIKNKKMEIILNDIKQPDFNIIKEYYIKQKFNSLIIIFNNNEKKKKKDNLIEEIKDFLINNLNFKNNCKIIKFHGLNLNNENLISFNDFLKKSKHIIEIQLNYCDLKTTDLNLIKEGILSCNIKILSLEGNTFIKNNNIIIDILEEGIKNLNQKNNFFEVNWSNCQLEEDFCYLLYYFLKYDKNIKILNLSKNLISKEAILKFIGLIKDYNKNLISLDFRENIGLDQKLSEELLYFLKENFINYKDNEDKLKKIKNLKKNVICKNCEKIQKEQKKLFLENKLLKQKIYEFQKQYLGNSISLISGNLNEDINLDKKFEEFSIIKNKKENEENNYKIDAIMNDFTNIMENIELNKDNTILNNENLTNSESNIYNNTREGYNQIHSLNFNLSQNNNNILDNDNQTNNNTVNNSLFMSRTQNKILIEEEEDDMILKNNNE